MEMPWKVSFNFFEAVNQNVNILNFCLNEASAADRFNAKVHLRVRPVRIIS